MALAYQEKLNTQKCRINNCNNMVVSKGLCEHHYHHLHKYGDPLYRENYPIRFDFCKVCKKPATHKGLGLCNEHFYLYSKYGDPNHRVVIKLPHICSVSSCKENVYKENLCNKHFFRLHKYNKFKKTKCLVKNCGKLVWGDYCEMHTKSLRVYNDPNFIDSPNYAENRAIFKDNLKIKPFNKYFFDVWSHESAYVLGYLFADGHLRGYSPSYNIKFPRGVTFLSTDQELADAVAKAFNFPKSLMYVRPPILSGKNKRKIAWSCDLRSMHLARQAFNKGLLPKKIMRLRMPKGIPDEFLFDFLRGLFDGDGTFGSSNWSICSVVPELLNDIKLKLHTFGIDSTINSSEISEFHDRSKLTGKFIHNISVRGEDLFKLYFLIYRNIKGIMYLARKQHKFENWIESYVERKFNYIIHPTINSTFQNFNKQQIPHISTNT